MAQEKVSAEQLDVLDAATGQVLALSGSNLDLGNNGLIIGTTDEMRFHESSGIAYLDLSAVSTFKIRDGATDRFSVSRTNGNTTISGVLNSASVSTGGITATSLSVGTGTIAAGTINNITSIGGTGSLSINKSSTSFGNNPVTIGACTLTGEGIVTNDSDIRFGNQGMVSAATHMYLGVEGDGLGTGNLYVTAGGYNTVAASVILTLTNAGDLTAVGNVTAYSDERIKTNIKVIENPLDKVKQIDGVTYQRRDIPNSKVLTGVLAQQVEQVLPEVVFEDEHGMKSVAYGNMVGLLVEAIKELKEEVDELKSQLGK